jgi:phosphoglycerate dehydrogenase-like enzyme
MAEPIRVTVAMNFSDEILHSLQEISPRLHIERHHPNVPDAVWQDTEILYTLNKFPDPAQAPQLRWIQMHLAGMDAILEQPIMQIDEIAVTSASGVHAVQMAEYCLGMMLAFEYKIPKMLRYQDEAHWPENRHQLFAPQTLRGKTLGIVGYGSIGRELARIAQAFGMQILASKRDAKNPADDGASYTPDGLGDPSGDIPERIYPTEATASMVSLCDYVVLITPLTQHTKHLIDEKVLKAMKKTAVLINVARGQVVDELALIHALTSGTIGGAALDVFNEEPLPRTSPLWGLDNVIISPHISGNTSQYHEKAAAVFAENLRRYLDQRPLLNRLQRERGY